MLKQYDNIIIKYLLHGLACSDPVFLRDHFRMLMADIKCNYFHLVSVPSKTKVCKSL